MVFISFRFPHQNTVFHSLPCVPHAPPIWFILSNHSSTGEKCKSWSSSSCNFHHPLTFSQLGLNVLISTLFSNTISLLASLYVKDKVPLSYKTRGRSPAKWPCARNEIWYRHWGIKFSAHIQAGSEANLASFPMSSGPSLGHGAERLPLSSTWFEYGVSCASDFSRSVCYGGTLL